MAQRLLIVEDEPEIASYLTRGLAYEGYVVEHVPSGGAALAAARERPPDLVILDLGLPDMDGLEVTRRLRAGPPLAFAKYFEPGGVDHQMKRFILTNAIAKGDIEGFGPPAERAVIRHGQLKLKEGEQRAYKAFGLTQG